MAEWGQVIDAAEKLGIDVAQRLLLGIRVRVAMSRASLLQMENGKRKREKKQKMYKGNDCFLLRLH